MALYTEEEMRNQQAGALGAIGLGLLLAVSFVNTPGMLLIALYKSVSGAPLDGGQMWTFSFLVSALLLGLVRVIVGQWPKAFTLYAISCATIAGVFLFCHFGFKALFPAQFLGFFF